MKAAGCEAVIIGHCEERNNLTGILAEAGCKDTKAVNRILNQEVKCAVSQGMKVLYCKMCIRDRHMEKQLRISQYLY